MEMIGLLTYIGAFFTGTTAAAIFACTIGKAWIEKRIEHSIAHEYAKKLADHEHKLAEQNILRQEQREIRQRAALVAELLACWIMYEDREKLNKLSFEAFLWLPKDIALQVSKTLAGEDNSLEEQHLIAMVRELLLGADQAISPGDVVVFEDDVVRKTLHSV